MRRRAETRAALLRAAMSLVQKRGIHGMRIEDITERADVGKGVFYNYFDAKEALIAALVQEGVELLDREYLCQLTSHGDLSRRVEALANAQEAFYRDHPDYALLFHQARGLLQLGGTRGASLRGAFATYLTRLSALLAGEHESDWSATDLLDISAAMAGAAAGYRSFCIAAERTPRPATVGSALMAGLPQLLEERRRAATPSG